MYTFVIFRNKIASEIKTCGKNSKLKKHVRNLTDFKKLKAKQCQYCELNKPLPVCKNDRNLLY